MSSVEGFRDALLVLHHLITVAEGKPISGVFISVLCSCLVEDRRIRCVLCDACSRLLYPLDEPRHALRLNVLRAY
jgi:hypothetical protein